MAVKRSVTIPLTAGQKERIKKATGKSISSMRVESAGRLKGVKLMQTTRAVPGPIPPPESG